MKFTSLAVQSLGELVDGWGNLQTLVEDGALPLQADITRPFHKACQVTLGLNILACGRKRAKYEHITSNRGKGLFSLKCISDLGGKLSALSLR